LGRTNLGLQSSGRGKGGEKTRKDGRAVTRQPGAMQTIAVPRELIIKILVGGGKRRGGGAGRGGHRPQGKEAPIVEEMILRDDVGAHLKKKTIIFQQEKKKINDLISSPRRGWVRGRSGGQNRWKIAERQPFRL